jgi:hypothetical protein
LNSAHKVHSTVHCNFTFCSEKKQRRTEKDEKSIKRKRYHNFQLENQKQRSQGAVPLSPSSTKKFTIPPPPTGTGE